MTKQVWFIRHGQSVTNAGGTWHDAQSIPLTEHGHRQAKAVAQGLPHKPSLIITSPYTRTLETARPTLDKWPDVVHEEWDIHEFNYLCPVRMSNVSPSVFLKHDRLYWEKDDPHHQDSDHSESFVQFMERVDKAVEKVLSLSHDKTFVFSHALFLKGLFYRFENPDENMSSREKFKDVFFNYRIGNTAVAHFTIHEDGSKEMHSLTMDHLEEDDHT